MRVEVRFRKVTYEFDAAQIKNVDGHRGDVNHFNPESMTVLLASANYVVFIGNYSGEFITLNLRNAECIIART